MPDSHTSTRRGPIRIARRLWLATAVGLTLAVLVPIAAYSCFYVDEAVGSRVVCLMYHRFTTLHQYAQCQGDDRYYAVPVDTFEQHLKYLSTHGYHALDTRECMDFLDGRREVPAKSVFLSIDDGYVSTLTFAQPLLKKYGMRATLFVTADPAAEVFKRGIPVQRRMTDDELRRLDPSVIEVQAHGLTHRPLTSLKDSELLSELVEARKRLEHIVHTPVRCMAVPGNDYDDRVLAFAKQAGYATVFTSDPGSLDVGDDPIGLPRVNVAGYFDVNGLESILAPSGMARRKFFRAITVGPSRVLGVSLGGAMGRLAGAAFSIEPPSLAHFLAAAIIIAVWCGPAVCSRAFVHVARKTGVEGEKNFPNRSVSGRAEP